MRIKSLTIHGFKSFADKTILHFPTGTSAVIGPNGCGKSNIVDAIRWVIGEQNPRHLRGKLMEDVIFNGSESRKPLGMAEVVLTFSNERGRAPARYANFTEIEVARRLYRSGESEYYLNKVQCRLRDVVDLFADTGVGRRAYSIVEQGQVGWLINAKPEERRIIFEEAAGINKFKQKKDAALRRLDGTKENLTRVNDIISEVKRQLNSLNRQARKAERYRALKEELKGVDLLLASVDFRNIRKKIEEISMRLDVIKDSEAELSARMATKEALSEEIREKHSAVETEFNSIRERVYHLERRIHEEESSGKLASMRADELSRTEERLRTEIEGLNRRREAACEEIARLKSSLVETSTSMGEENRRFEALSAEFEALWARIRERGELESSLKSEVVSFGATLSDIRHSIQAVIKDEEFQRIRQARALSESEEIKRTLEGKEEPVRVIKEKLEESGRKKESAESGFLGVREKLSALEDKRTLVDEELKALKERHTGLSSRLKTLEEMERNLENVKDGARAVVLKGEVPGVVGLMADVIETNPGYEKAVEAVLGERLQYVIVESQARGVEAIEYLKARSLGRGSFVPVNDSRPLASPVAIHSGVYSRPGARELLSEVRVKEGYSAMVNCLLGDTLLVDDLKTAVEIWKANGMYKTLVTPEGDVINPQGIITGGRGSGTDGGILQKRSEIKETRKLLSGLDVEIRELASGMRAAEGEIEKTRAELEDCRNRFHSIEIERVNIASELIRHEEDIQRLTGRRAALGADMEEAARALADISERKLSLSREREELEGVLSGKEEELKTLSAEISSLAENKERLSAAVTETKVLLAKINERHDSLKTQVLEKEGSIGEFEGAAAARTGEIENGKAEIAEKRELVEVLKARVEELLAEIGEAREKEVSRQEALTELSEKIRAVDAEIKGLKADLSELHELRGELSIESREMELNSRHLSDNIVEKYGVEIGGYTPEGEVPGDTAALKARREDLRERITSMGEVSLSALDEYNELEGRYNFLLEQQQDLNSSVQSLLSAIARINRTSRERFLSTFEEINEKFKEYFPRFFNGGRAELRLSDEGDVLESGIEIVAQPPGKKLQNIALLSGGEKALTATSLIFSIFLIKPSPFCLLDEVDAPLDDANIDRFNGFVKEISELSQFLLITHNKRTMEMADTLYGVTMEDPGASKIISVRL